MYEAGLPKYEINTLKNAVDSARQSQKPAVLDNAIEALVNEGYDITPDMENALHELLKPQAIREPTVEGELPSVDIETDVDIDNFKEDDVLRAALEQAKYNHPNKQISAGDALRIVATSPSSTKTQKWIAKKLAPMLDKVNTKLILNKFADGYSQKISAKTGKSQTHYTHGSFTAGDNTIKLNGVSSLTIIHEAIHALTADVVNGTIDTPEAIALRQKWQELAAYARKHIAGSGKTKYVGKDILDAAGLTESDRLDYLLSNTVELMTVALTDPVARNVLMAIPAKNPKMNNLWDEWKNMLTEYMAKVFNFTPAERTLFDDILEMTAATAELTARTNLPKIRGELNYASKYNQGRPDNAAQVAHILAQPEARETILDDEYNEALDEAATVAELRSVVTPATVGPTPPKKTKNPRVKNPVTKLQELWELFAHAGLGIEKSIEEVLNNGGKVLAEYNPYYAWRKFSADMAEMKSLDNMETVEPVRSWLGANWRKLGYTDADLFRKDLDKFQQAYHLLHERNPTIWANEVDLSVKGDIQRDKLIQDAYNGTIDGPTLNKQLIALASREATISLDQWTATTKYAKDNAALRKQLRELKAKGLDEHTLADFNKLVDGVRERARDRQFQSGIITKDDPFVDRGWEWYVPLKDHLSTDPSIADYDIGSGKGTTNAVRKAKLKTMQGRQSTASNSLTQLVEDMNNAATNAAKGEFTGKLFEYAVLVKENARILQSKYTKYYGTPKEGYYAMIKKVDPKTGKTTFVRGKMRAELPSPKYGFVHNNGNEHYVVYLPKASQLLRGLTKINNVNTPGRMESRESVGKALKVVGIGTNILSRAYTTWNPIWAATVGFLRDTTTLPTTVAVTIFPDPIKAAGFATRYAGNLAVNMANLSRLPSVLKTAWGDKAAMRKYALDPANKDSLFAKIYAYRQAGGSTEFEQGFNQERADDFLFGDLQFTRKSLLKPYDKWNEITSNWAGLLENVGRVSAWEALMSEGYSPEEAAALSKSAMDYSQSGEWGRMINTFHSFFRVSATSADTIRRAFTKKGGGFDFKKAAWWGPTFASMGYVAYLMMAAMLGDDEEGNPRIDKMDAKTLMQKFVFPGPEGKATAFPIGLGLPQLLLGPGILAAAVNNGHISEEEAVEAYYDVVKRQSPISPLGQKEGTGPVGFLGAWVGGVIPTLARPVIEAGATNTNAFGNTVHTEFVDKNKFKSSQGMPSTSPEWTDIATWVRETTGGAVDMYPEDYAHMARGYGGQLASELIRQTIDKDAAAEQGLDSSAIRNTLRFNVTDEDFYYRNEARKAKDELIVSRKLAKDAAERDGITEDRWLARNPQHRRRVAELKVLEAAQKTYYEDIAKIRGNKLLATEGRRLQRKRADSRLRQAVERAQRAIDRTAD